VPDAKFFRAIYGCCKQHGVDNELLHDIVAVRFGKTSLKDLTNQECHLLLDGIRGKQEQRGGGVSGYKRTERGAAMAQAGRNGWKGQTEWFVNDREMRMLREAALLRGWSQDTLDAFVARQLKGAPLRTIGQFNKVFGPLKAMNKRDGLYG
jgi:hypothetical protein